MKLFHIIAICPSTMCIGKNGKLPWPHNKEDMKHFKSTTNGKVVIMGRKTFERKTFESLPNGALPNRVNIVITKDKSYVAENAIVCFSIQEALDNANVFNLDAFVIGGSEIYNQTIDLINGKIITIIDGDYDGDTFLPDDYLSDPSFVDVPPTFKNDALTVLYKQKNNIN